MITDDMKRLLQEISDLCYKASEEVYENGDIKDILNTCDILQELIDGYLNK